MTLPQPILPGGLYFVTRRTCGGVLRLRPDRKVNQLVEYCVAVAAARYDIKIIAFVCLSNHWHALLWDPKGIHPQFVQWVNSVLGRAINRLQGVDDHFWSAQRSRPVLIPDRETLLRTLTYIFTNPSAAHLAERSRDWPGFVTDPMEIGTWRATVKRPTGFFREDGPEPEEARLRLWKPPHFGLKGVKLAAFQKELQACVEDRERQIREERRAKNRKVMSRAQVLAQDPFGTPRNPMQRSEIIPRVATQDTELRVAILEYFRNFLGQYRMAMARFRAPKSRRGDQKIVFPFGTYAMRLMYSVACCKLPDFLVPLVT